MIGTALHYTYVITLVALGAVYVVGLFTLVANLWRQAGGAK
jgi:hypothetical protein